MRFSVKWNIGLISSVPLPIRKSLREAYHNVFCCIKTDLDLRPVYHKSDIACLAHLPLGILAYWVVTGIRYQLQQKGINKIWSQMLDIMLTHKSVTSETKNLHNELIHIEQCS